VRLPAPPLLLITDRKQARAPLADVVKAALSAGCRWVSLREKDLSKAEQIALAAELLPVARRSGARLTLHGDPALAKSAGLDGLHLPAGADVATARDLLGSKALVGISVHSPEDLGGEIAGLNYVIAGPAYETGSKPGYGPALGPAGIAALAAKSSVPVIALGGIDAENTSALIRAGASGIAVMGGVMRADDPAEEISRLLAALVQERS
jgi:thiamine-phosphate pyrophosphorylase